MDKKIDIIKEILIIFISLFILETFLDLLSFIIYPSIFPNLMNMYVTIFLFSILVISIIGLYLINKENIYGYSISFIISILILFSAFTLNSYNIIDISVRNIASNYGVFPNPIILLWGIVIFSISLRKMIYLVNHSSLKNVNRE